MPDLYLLGSEYVRTMTAKSSARDRIAALRADPEILRWYKAHRSESTAQVQLAQLELFSRKAGKSPHEIARLGRAQAARESKEFEDLVLAWVASERKAGRPDSYISVNYAAVRSWLKHEESVPEWKPALKVRFGTTILDEIVPTPEQLRAVLDRTPVPRLRSLVLFLASSGVRIGVLGSEYRPDGLRLRQLSGLALDPKPHFTEKGPAKVDVPAELSKAGNPYFTFISEETKDALVQYLLVRLGRGELLTPNSAIFAPEPKAPHAQERRASDGVAFLSEKALGNELRRVLRRAQPAGVRWRPSVLRSFASSQLMLGENAGLITRDAREFILAHVADIGRRYNLGKGRVRDDLEREVAEMYARTADRFLRILTISEKGVDYRPILRVLLSGTGYSKAQIDAMGDLTEERVIEAIRAKRNETVQVEAPKPGENARVVSVSELDRYLSAGWKPISAAGTDRFVIGAPN